MCITWRAAQRRSCRCASRRWCAARHCRLARPTTASASARRAGATKAVQRVKKNRPQPGRTRAWWPTSCRSRWTARAPAVWRWTTCRAPTPRRNCWSRPPMPTRMAKCKPCAASTPCGRLPWWPASRQKTGCRRSKSCVFRRWHWVPMARQRPTCRCRCRPLPAPPPAAENAWWGASTATTTTPKPRTWAPSARARVTRAACCCARRRLTSRARSSWWSRRATKPATRRTPPPRCG